MAPRGLVFNEGKTRIVTPAAGFDFLGVNVRRYHDKLRIKPSKAAVRGVRQRLAAEMKALRGGNVNAVLYQLNPIIRGWAAYYRTVVSSRTFASLDHYAWKLTYRWARRRHPNKSRHWVVDRYFGAFNTSRQDRWVFGDRDSGAYLVKFAWTKIVRHQVVKGGASPDDPALAGYWAARRHRRKPPLDPTGLRLLQVQHGRCPLCRGLLLHADHEPQSPREWEQWLKVTRKAIGNTRSPSTPDAARRTNPSPTVSSTPAAGAGPISAPAATWRLCTPASPRGLLEPGASKRRTPGVRREALRCIPCAVGTDSEGGSWVARFTWRGNLKGTRACRGSGGRLEAYRSGCRKTRTIWPRLDCLKPNLQW
jgi:RNA-directed DNA polymerase